MRGPQAGLVGPGPDQAAAQNLRGCQSCRGAAEPGSTAPTAGSPYPGQRIRKDTGLMGGGVDSEGSVEFIHSEMSKESNKFISFNLL